MVCQVEDRYAISNKNNWKTAYFKSTTHYLRTYPAPIICGKIFSKKFYNNKEQIKKLLIKRSKINEYLLKIILIY